MRYADSPASPLPPATYSGHRNVLVHQYHVVVRHRDFRQPGVIGACQINFLERQTQPDGNRRNQYVVRTGQHPNPLANTQLQNPCTFYRSGIVNAEADIPVARQHRLPLFILQSTGGNKQTHRPNGFRQASEQLYPLLGNNPEQRVGYQIYLRAELLEHRGSNAEIHRQQRLALYKVRSFPNRTVQ